MDHVGRLPDTFVVDGKTYTPREFARDRVLPLIEGIEYVKLREEGDTPGRSRRQSVAGVPVIFQRKTYDEIQKEWIAKVDANQPIMMAMFWDRDLEIPGRSRASGAFQET